MASAGKTGVWAGCIAGRIGALGGNGFGTPLQAVNSITGASSISGSSAGFGLCMGLYLLMASTPLRFGLSGLLVGLCQRHGSVGTLTLARRTLCRQARLCAGQVALCGRVADEQPRVCRQ